MSNRASVESYLLEALSLPADGFGAKPRRGIHDIITESPKIAGRLFLPKQDAPRGIEVDGAMQALMQALDGCHQLTLRGYYFRDGLNPSRHDMEGAGNRDRDPGNDNVYATTDGPGSRAIPTDGSSDGSLGELGSIRVKGGIDSCFGPEFSRSRNVDFHAHGSHPIFALQEGHGFAERCGSPRAGLVCLEVFFVVEQGLAEGFELTFGRSFLIRSDRSRGTSVEHFDAQAKRGDLAGGVQLRRVDAARVAFRGVKGKAASDGLGSPLFGESGGIDWDRKKCDSETGC